MYLRCFLYYVMDMIKLLKLLTMPTEEQNKEKAFKEELQDNTIRSDPSNINDPKPQVTNQDKKITNEDEQKILTEETDNHNSDAETVGEKSDLAPIPETDSTAFIIELTEEEKLKNRFRK